MKRMSVSSERCLPAAIDRLYAAVARFADPAKELTQDALRVAPSLYEQLCEQIPAVARGDGRLRGAGRSVSPVWTDALDLRIEIDDAAQAWLPAGESTPRRLRALAARRWRPQDTKAVEQIAAAVESWAAGIAALLSPQRVKHVSAPCPACGASTVYRRDGAGELVRQPALQIVAEHGCTCQACAYTWAPSHYVHLARVLGYDMPAGVLE
jgi:hypothetical protein